MLLFGGLNARAEPGRFQIFAGEIETPRGKEKRVFKIDTTTGETWVFICAPVDGKEPRASMEGWLRAIDNLGAELESFRAGMMKAKPPATPRPSR